MQCFNNKKSVFPSLNCKFSTQIPKIKLNALWKQEALMLFQLTCGSWKLWGNFDEYHGNMSDPSTEEWERPSEWPNSWAATANKLVGGWLSELDQSLISFQYGRKHPKNLYFHINWRKMKFIFKKESKIFLKLSLIATKRLCLFIKPVCIFFLPTVHYFIWLSLST
jgi:hypothetical protein